MYAVNWPAEEADLTPITPAELVKVLGTEAVTLERVDSSAAMPAQGSGGWLGLPDAGRTLGIVLLVLFVAEMLVATRQPTPQPTR